MCKPQAQKDQVHKLDEVSVNPIAGRVSSGVAVTCSAFCNTAGPAGLSRPPPAPAPPL